MMNEEGTDGADSSESEEKSKSTLAELADIVKARQGEFGSVDTSTPEDSAESSDFEWVGEDEKTQTADRLEEIKNELRVTAEQSPEGLKEKFPSLSDESLDDLLQTAENDIEDTLSEVANASNILVLDSTSDSWSDRCCTELLTRTTLEQSNVLCVSLTESADERLNVWQNHVDTLPAEMAIITAGDQQQSSQSTSVISTGERSGTISINTLDDPADLPRLGILISQTITAWEDSPNQIAVCIRSLTELLQYVDSKRLFRFIHLLQNRLDTMNTTAHYHIKTEAHDEQTITVFKSLFDAVLQIDENGDVEVVSKLE